MTQAAAEVGFSQPAMSRALARCARPLAIRCWSVPAAGLAPTVVAESLAPKVAAALGEVRGLFRAPDFDPATLVRTFRIAASDAQTVLLGPPLVARLQREAPGVDLRFEPIGRDIIARIERGAVDLVFATAATPLPPGAQSEILARDRLALVMRRGHPAAGRDWTLSDYAAWPACDGRFLWRRSVGRRCAARRRGAHAQYRADISAFHGGDRRDRDKRSGDDDFGRLLGAFRACLTISSFAPRHSMIRWT